MSLREAPAYAVWGVGSFVPEGGSDFVKRVVYLATGALVAVLILVPSALAQGGEFPGDTDVCSPEPGAVVVDENTLQQIAGQPLPSEGPTSEPVGGQPSTCEVLPGTGGLDIGSVLLPVVLVSALLLLLGFAILRRVPRRR
jgi:hypothetical protein